MKLKTHKFYKLHDTVFTKTCLSPCHERPLVLRGHPIRRSLYTGFVIEQDDTTKNYNNHLRVSLISIVEPKNMSTWSLYLKIAIYSHGADHLRVDTDLNGSAFGACVDMRRTVRRLGALREDANCAINVDPGSNVISFYKNHRLNRSRANKLGFYLENLIVWSAPGGLFNRKLVATEHATCTDICIYHTL